MSSRSVARALAAAAALAAACRAPDPRQELSLEDVETYWAIERPLGDTQLIAPVIRFHVVNRGPEGRRSIQAMANFRREGEDANWSTGFWQHARPGGTPPLEPGGKALVVLKPEGEGRYKSTGAPESMFDHELFRDVKAEVFLKVGSSSWVRFVEVPVERRIGSREVRDLTP